MSLGLCRWVPANTVMFVQHRKAAAPGGQRGTGDVAVLHCSWLLFFNSLSAPINLRFPSHSVPVEVRGASAVFIARCDPAIPLLDTYPRESEVGT